MKGFKSEHTIWRQIDGVWQNIERTYVTYEGIEVKTLYCGCLAEYLFLIAMDVPDYITYCLAESTEYKMKFRKHGNNISIYLNPNK